MKLIEKGNSLQLYMPFHPLCSQIFRELSGEWKKGYWEFPINWKKELQRALLDNFGEDGENPQEKVTVLIKGRAGDIFFLEDRFYNVCFLGKIIFRYNIPKGKKPKDGKLIINKDFKVFGYKRREWKTDGEVFKDLFVCEGFAIHNVSKYLADQLYQENEKNYLGLDIKLAFT